MSLLNYHHAQLNYHHAQRSLFARHRSSALYSFMPTSLADMHDLDLALMTTTAAVDFFTSVSSDNNNYMLSCLSRLSPLPGGHMHVVKDEEDNTVDYYCEDANNNNLPPPPPVIAPLAVAPSPTEMYSSASSENDDSDSSNASDDDEEEEQAGDSQSNSSGSEDEEDDDSEDDDDDEDYSRRPHKRARRSAPAAATSRARSHASTGAAGAFAKYYKRSVRSCESVSMGTFDVEQDGFALQYLSETQPIPNHVVNKFKMFGEKWHSSIEYEYLQTGTSTTTALRFTITHVESNTSTSAVETAKEVKMRRTSAKPRTICNRVFLQALGKCRNYLLTLPRTAENKTKLASLSVSGKARKCTESISLFGLRSEFMKDFCLDFLQQQQQQQQQQQ